MCQPGFRTRTSLRELEKNPEKLNAFLRAFKKIKAKPPTDPESFWVIGSWHGEPFNKAGADVNTGFGGYCQHASVLFPQWHRFQLLRLEDALRNACPDADLYMPYWDETSEEGLKKGIPDIITRKTVCIDGVEQENPLASFTFPIEIKPDSSKEYYAKPAGYKTVRYPYSGISHPESARKAAEKHNATVDHDQAVATLNKNVLEFLNGAPGQPNANTVHKQYIDCLEEDNFNVFSNTHSGKQSQPNLEQAHNEIHFSIGGNSVLESQTVKGANGDMGANETAGFDPIFYFHHSNVDRLFWVWQKKHNHTKDLDIELDDTDSGRNPSAGQGPSPGQKADQLLSMDSPMPPFQVNGRTATSRDCINIENQLDHTYTIGSLDKKSWPVPKPKKNNVHHDGVKKIKDIKNLLPKGRNRQPQKIFIDVTDVDDWDEICDIPFFQNPHQHEHKKFKHEDNNYDIKYMLTSDQINRAAYPGSFGIRAYHIKDGKRTFIGAKSILNRWNANQCKNCQNHRSAPVSFDLGDLEDLTTHPTLDQFQLEVVYNDPSDGIVKVVPINFAGEHKSAAKLIAVLEADHED